MGWGPSCQRALTAVGCCHRWVVMGTFSRVGEKKRKSNPQSNGMLVGQGCTGERRWNRRDGGLVLGEGLADHGGLWGRDEHGSGPLWLKEKIAWPSIG